MILVSPLRIVLNYLIAISLWFSLCPPAFSWLISENGDRRPLLLAGEGDVSSADLPVAIRTRMRVDALARTVEWAGDLGWIRGAAGERLVLQNGRRIVLPRPIRFFESSVFFPEDLLTHFADIFSFVDVAAGADSDVLNVGTSPAEVSPDIRPVSAGAAVPSGRAIRTVVIDAGHGGGDPGAKGKAGAVEKDITLGIALQLARSLQLADRSLKVILTRSRDEFISLQDRARIANTGKGDLFVSIHANSVRRNDDADGFEVYHLDIDGANDDARAIAAFENSANPKAGKQDPSSDLSRILGDVMQLQYLNASQELSKDIGDGLTATLEGASKFRGCKGAYFYVLKDVMAPAVLVEVGFVTNEWEASFLQKPWYQRKIAAGVLQGILTFKRAEDARISAAPPSADSPSPSPSVQGQ